ncbi:MAG TPA: FAD-dependent oxidoreductase [Gammaproteobacteria bacterium]|nr:FAD-dependent oxidoreductase [Gammaproteobacteria bacterium]
MNVGIAGAGIMGQLMTFMLINAGHDVTLFDQSKSANCSMAAAGLLTPLSELEKNDLDIYRLGVESLNNHWPEIIRKLNQEVYFKKSGSLFVSHSRDSEALNYIIKLISAKLNSPINPIAIKDLEPELSKFNTGFYFQDEGQIDSQQILMLLQEYLLGHGVIWHKNSFVSEISAGQVKVQDNTQEKTHKFDVVIDCRGLGAKQIFNNLRGLRGELIWLYAPHVNISRPVRFHHPRYSLYIAPRPNQIYIIGASEIESEDYSDISVQTTLELLTAAYYIHPGFSDARIIKTITHCRPTLVDHKPEIKYSHKFIAINGLYRHGFLIAPSLAYEVMKNL